MRISARPDIAGNEEAVEELRAGLESAVAVAVAESDMPAMSPDRQSWPEHDVVAHAAADAAPRVAELLETMIAERLARQRLYAGTVEDEARRN